MPHFLLPCDCGRKHSVTTAQAGDRIACECGRNVEVPTLRHFTDLEQVSEAPAKAAASWSARQGLILLGAAVVLLAAAGIVFLYIKKPETIHDPIAIIKIDKMTPAQLWAVWPRLEEGIIRPLAPIEAAILKRNMFDIEVWHQLRLAAFIIAGLGLAIVAAGLFVPQQRRRPMAARLKTEG